MVDPIQYLSPGQAGGFAQGYSLGNEMIQSRLLNAANEEKLRQQQLATQQAQRQQEVLSNLMQKVRDGKVTSSDYEAATIELPNLREQMKQAFDIHSDKTKQGIVSEMSQVYSALSSKRPDLAKSVLQTRIDSMKNSGAPESEIQQVQTMLDNIETSPDFVMLNTGMMLQSIPGGDKVFQALDERRKQELQPGEVKKQEGELLQQAAQLGLTKAQTNETMVRTKNLSLEGKKTMLELEALRSGGGIVPPKDRIDAEQKLRKEYNDQTSNFQTVRESFGRIQSSEETPAGDIALIFNYMKMLDPGSVVREGEFATAQNAGGIDDRIINAYNKALTGERLNPAQRKQFQSQAEKLYKTAQNREEEVRKGMTGMVKRYGLDERNIFYQGNVEPQAPKPAQPQGGLPPGWGVTVR